jgi:S1-C subfamily serine protease
VGRAWYLAEGGGSAADSPSGVVQGRTVSGRTGDDIDVDERLNQLVTQQSGTKGVVVLRVTPGSAAGAAGLRGVNVEPNGRIVPSDIIVAVEGVAVESVARLLSRLDEHQVGDTVRLTVLRNGQETDVSVRLQAGNQ